jgi:hypothetical protein
MRAKPAAKKITSTKAEWDAYIDDCEDDCEINFYDAETAPKDSGIARDPIRKKAIAQALGFELTLASYAESPPQKVPGAAAPLFQSPIQKAKEAAAKRRRDKLPGCQLCGTQLIPRVPERCNGPEPQRRTCTS